MFKREGVVTRTRRLRRVVNAVAAAGGPAVTIVVTLLLAALQVLAGVWLARALVPRR